jgi:hypothetical protein
MAATQPAEVAVELYNRLLSLSYDQEAEIGRIMWRLRGAFSQKRGDERIAVAYLQAQIMTGDARGARETALTIWPKRELLPLEVQYTYGAQLEEIGEFEKCRDLIREATGDTSLPDEVWAWALECAIGLGDIEWLRKFGPSKGDNPVSVLLDRLHADGLAKAFVVHQHVLREVLRPRGFVGYDASVSIADDHPTLAISVFLGESRNERRAIEEEFDRRIADLFSQAGVQVSSLVPLVTAIILPVRAHWMPRASHTPS